MAGQGTVSVKAFIEPLGFVNVSAAALAAAVPLGGIPAGTKIAYIQADGGNVRYTDDGTVPTALIGMLLPDTGVLEYTGLLTNLKFILASGAPKLNVSYYK